MHEVSRLGRMRERLRYGLVMDLRTGDVSLYYESDGDPAAPPVLLLHGITQSTATWGWLVPRLVEDHRVVRLDFRGHGRSGRAPGAYGFPGYVADATAVCEEVLGRPAVIVGHSLGGGTAAGLAQTRSDLVRGVVLEDPAITEITTAADLDAVVREDNPLFAGFQLMRQSIPALQESGLSPAALADMLRGAPSPSGPSLRRGRPPRRPPRHGGGDAAARRHGARRRLRRLRAPVFDPNRTLPVPGIVLAGDPESPDTIVASRISPSTTSRPRHPAPLGRGERGGRRRRHLSTTPCSPRAGLDACGTSSPG